MTTACVIVAVGILVLGLFLVIIERTEERDEARREVDLLTAECNAHAAENARLTTEAALTDPATATTVPVPLLRAGKGLLSVVPPQRTRSEWPAIARVLGIEAGEER